MADLMSAARAIGCETKLLPDGKSLYIHGPSDQYLHCIPVDQADRTSDRGQVSQVIS